MRTLLLSLWLSISAALAQQEAKLCDALASDEARTVANAADDARTVLQRDVTKALRKALDHWARERRDHSELVRLLLLDALIEHRAKLPGDLLVPMLDDALTEIPALVLLCHEPEPNERILLDYLRRRYQFATGTQALDPKCELVADLLIEQRAPGLAAWLWSLPQEPLQIVVCDRGATFGPITFELPRMSRELHEPTPGFPAARRFQLVAEDDASQGSHRGLVTLVAPGRSRIAFTQANQAVSFRFGGGPPHHEWCARLAAFRPPVHALDMCSIDYAGDAAYLTDAVDRRARAIANRIALRDALVARGALLPDEAKQCDVSVEVVIDDRRRDRSRPLPDLPDAK